MSSSALRPWWRQPGPLLALLLHAAIFFGLFQLRFERGAWTEMERALPPEPTTKDWFNVLTRAHGYWGVVIWFFDTHQEAQLYRRYAEVAVRGIDPKLPAEAPRQGHLRLYQDLSMEYQPGALLMFVPPALVARTMHDYETAFTAWCGIVYLATLLLGFRLIAGSGGLPASAANRILWSSAIFLLCFGGVAAARFDHIVPLLCVLALLAFQRAVRLDSAPWFGVAGAVVAIGVLTKIVPGVLLPAMLLWLWAAGPVPSKAKSSVALIAGFGVTLLALHTASYGWWGEAYLRSYTYHLERGLQIESTYSGVILAGHGFGQPYEAVRQFGACDLITPFAGILLKLAPLLFLTSAAAISARFWSCRRALFPRPGIAVLLCATLFLFAFMLTNKVLSPQYLLWVGPLCALAYGARPLLRWAVALLILCAALSQALFPHLYDLLLHLEELPVALLNLRNALLLVIAVGLCWQLPRLHAGRTEREN